MVLAVPLLGLTACSQTTGNQALEAAPGIGAGVGLLGGALAGSPLTGALLGGALGAGAGVLTLPGTGRSRPAGLALAKRLRNARAQAALTEITAQEAKMISNTLLALALVGAAGAVHAQTYQRYDMARRSLWPALGGLAGTAQPGRLHAQRPGLQPMDQQATGGFALSRRVASTPRPSGTNTASATMNAATASMRPAGDLAAYDDAVRRHLNVASTQFGRPAARRAFSLSGALLQSA